MCNYATRETTRIKFGAGKTAKMMVFHLFQPGIRAPLENGKTNRSSRIIFFRIGSATYNPVYNNSSIEYNTSID